MTSQPTFQRAKHDRESPFIMIRRDFVQDPTISFEAKGYYGAILSNSIEIDEIPEKNWIEIDTWFKNNGGV